MPLIKKADVKAHLATRRAMRRAEATSSSQPDATGFSRPEPALMRSNVSRSSVQDHSSATMRDAAAVAVPPAGTQEPIVPEIGQP